MSRVVLTRDAPSEFGIGIGHDERLARRGVLPPVGPHRPLSPGRGINAGKQSGCPGRRIAP